MVVAEGPEEGAQAEAEVAVPEVEAAAVVGRS